MNRASTSTVQYLQVRIRVSRRIRTIRTVRYAQQLIAENHHLKTRRPGSMTVTAGDWMQSAVGLDDWTHSAGGQDRRLLVYRGAL